MPRIILNQQNGEYKWSGKIYRAGKIYDATNQEALYLVNRAKVAREVDAHGKDIASVSETEHNKKAPINPTRPPRPDDIKVAMIRLGGIGDSLILGVQAKAVKRKWPESYIVLYVRDRVSAEVVMGFNEVDHVIAAGDKNWVGILDKIREKDFDVVIDNRYVTRIYFKNPGLHSNFKALHDHAFEKYAKYYDKFPLRCNELTSDFPDKSEFDIMNETSLLKVKDHDFHYPLRADDFNMVKLIENDKYVTIHNGADIARQTKCWSTNHWIKVVAHLKSKGFKVIQLGRRLEELVDGAIDMTGKCTLKQTMAIIARSHFHIDTEGGLVHIARMVGTRSIVLFGPTPLNFFGYKENINISSPCECAGCWWKTDFWWRECPKGFQDPTKCMQDLTPDMVIKRIPEIEKLDKLVTYDLTDFNEQWAMEMPLDEGHYRAEKCQWDRVYTMMEKVRGRKVLEVGAGDGYCARVLMKRGHEVTATEVSKIRLERMKRNGINALYADVNKLPFPDNFFDSVICGEVLEHIESPGQGLKELERVCKPDGKIILSLPVSKPHWEFKGHLWGLEHHSILRDGELDMIVLTMERINRDG